MKYKLSIKGYLIVGIGALLALIMLVFMIRFAIADRYGVPVTVMVVRVPERCISRGPKIKVEYKDRTYSLSISRESCKNGKYDLGETVTASYYEPFDIMGWPDAHVAEKYLIIFVPLVLLVVYNFRQKLKEYKKKGW